MDPGDDNKKTAKPSNHQVHMANERTFLAWIRTSIGLIAFGFVVEKFSFFVKKLTYVLGKPEASADMMSSLGYSSIFGVVLVGMGGVMGVMSFFRFKQIRREIEDDTYRPSLVPDVMAAILIFAIGSFFVIYMIHTF